MAETKLLTVAELAAHVGGRLVGDGSLHIAQVANLDSAAVGEIAYVEDEKFFEAGRASNASCLIVSPEFVASLKELIIEHEFGPALIEVAKPKLAFALVAELLHPQKRREPFVHPTAVIAEGADIDLTVFIGAHVAIGEGARIGAGTRIEAGVSIGEHVTVGRDCVLHPGVILYDDVTIGDRVILHAGVCIGADGFGYVRDDEEGGGYHKFPQRGTVLVEDDVELGAYTCVDSAALGRTRIGRGTKIDNLVHVGHNCDIGERVVIAAQTGISGSVVIEDDVVIGGQVGFGDHIRVLSGAVIGSKAGVLPGKIVRPGVWWGIPIQPLDEYKRLNAHLGRLPQMREEIKELRKRLDELEKRRGE
ncbi:MAG: UDP-3-O-(3-hydroxymyristoyl)glucosamine N-acyltransferase [Acidobacteriota bacterium]|nr:UDP-3-O-(3-hydroxymyristoyl)glucosamine N-acyltransferase [Acidobacteriota bacterium]